MMRRISGPALWQNVLTQWRNPSRRQLMMMMAATIAGSGITLGVQLLLSRMLPPAEFGELRMVLGYFLLAAPFVLLGVVAPLGRLAVSPAAAGRRRVYWNETLRWWVPVALIITVVSCILAMAGLISANLGLAFPLCLMMVSLPLWGIMELYQNFWKFTREREVASVGVLVAKLGMIGGLFAVMIAPLRPVTAFAIGYGTGSLLALLIMMVMNRSCTARLPQQEGDLRMNAQEWKLVKQILPVALVANVVNVVAAQMDVVLLDRFAVDPHIVGLYMFALMFTNAVLLVQDPILSYFLPELGQTHEHEPHMFLRKVFRYQLMMFGLMVTLALTTVLIVPVLVKFAFNAAYMDAMVYLPVIALVAVVQGSVGMFYHGLFLRNQMHLSTLFTLLATCVAVIIAIVAMPVWGVWGLIVAKLVGGLGFAVMAITALLLGKDVPHKHG